MSGTFEITLSDDNGSSKYKVDYSYPGEVLTGSNLTIQATVNINTLRGLRLFLADYRIDVIISAPGKLVAQGHNASGGRYLYEGAHWGPRKILIPINASSSGAGPGQRVPVNISISFLADVWYDFPISYFYPEQGSKVVGSVLIVNPTGANTTSYWLPLALLVGVVLSAAYFGRRKLYPNRGR